MTAIINVLRGLLNWGPALPFLATTRTVDAQGRSALPAGLPYAAGWTYGPDTLAGNTISPPGVVTPPGSGTLEFFNFGVFVNEFATGFTTMSIGMRINNGTSVGGEDGSGNYRYTLVVNA